MRGFETSNQFEKAFVSVSISRSAGITIMFVPQQISQTPKTRLPPVPAGKLSVSSANGVNYRSDQYVSPYLPSVEQSSPFRNP
jgi:hypothetical protein